jgi:hypothetical protein
VRSQAYLETWAGAADERIQMSARGNGKRGRRGRGNDAAMSLPARTPTGARSLPSCRTLPIRVGTASSTSNSPVKQPSLDSRTLLPPLYIDTDNAGS